MTLKQDNAVPLQCLQTTEPEQGRDGHFHTFFCIFVHPDLDSLLASVNWNVEKVLQELVLVQDFIVPSFPLSEEKKQSLVSGSMMFHHERDTRAIQ